MTTLDTILDKPNALRKLLINTSLHIRETSIKAEDITPEKEPAIRNQLSALAAQIVANPALILTENYDSDVRAKDWRALVKKVVLENGQAVRIDSRSRPGHKILDHWMPHFWDVKNHKGQSVRGMITQAAMEKALMANIRMHSTPYRSEIRRMLTMTGGVGNVTKYRTITAKTIVQFFGAKRVLDPCIGWGGRMLGTLAAADDTVYVGCEPDPATAAGLRHIRDDPALPAGLRERCRILEKPAEDGLVELALMPKFDCVLTSPPYFNLEIYTAGAQSTTTWINWDDWVDKWLKVVILGCLACLKEGGVSCWSVKNFKSDKKYALADVTKKIHEDAGWRLVKTFTMRGSGRPGKDRMAEVEEEVEVNVEVMENGVARIVTQKIKQKKTVETRESEEETFCFKKV